MKGTPENCTHPAKQQVIQLLIGGAEMVICRRCGHSERRDATCDTELLRPFEIFLGDQDYAENTISAYLQDIKSFFVWFEQTNGMPCTGNSLTNVDMRDYRDFRLQRKHSIHSVIRSCKSLAAFIRFLEHNNLVDEGHRLKAPKKPKLDPYTPKWLSRIERLNLLRATERNGTDVDLAVIVFLLNTGLRLSEFISLDLVDIELSERLGLVHIHQGKGMKERRIPLNGEARGSLRILIDQPREGTILYPHHSRKVQRLCVKMGRIADIDRKVTPHTLRHTFAKDLVVAGVDIVEVAALMGHSSTATTQIYTTTSEEELRAAVVRIEES